MHHVLYHLEEQLGCIALWIVVGTTLCIHIGYLLIVAALRCTNLTDALQQIIEVVLSEVFALFQSLIVKHKALDDKLLQHTCSPDAELRGLIAVHTIAHSNDSIEVINQRIVVFPIGRSYWKFSNNCLFFQFSCSENLSKMIVYRANVNSIQICHSFLRKPERLSIKQHLDTRFALIRFIYQNARSHLIFNQFQSWRLISKIDSCCLYLLLLAISIFCYDETSHA